VTRDEVKEIFKAIILSYPSMPELTSEKIDLWHSLLKDISFSDAKKSVEEHIKTSRFIPTIADIRNAVRESKSKYSDYRNTDTYRQFLQIKDGEAN